MGLLLLRTLISIHALLAESDYIIAGTRNRAIRISIHALLAESDPQAIYPSLTPPKFLSTLSLRRATYCVSSALAPKQFLSTLSLRRATGRVNLFGFKAIISIHALLAESDRTKTAKEAAKDISIHALLAESDGGKDDGAEILRISIHALLAESDI